MRDLQDVRLATARSGMARNRTTGGHSGSWNDPGGTTAWPAWRSRSRYIEAEVDGLVVGCLYLPNGNPAPGPKFDYKLRWFERLISYGQDLLKEEVPSVLCGDFNVVPTPI